MNALAKKGHTAEQAAKAMASALRRASIGHVLAQPHRLGDESELRESALGRFVLDYQCGRECYQGGLEYLSIVRKWRRAKGIPAGYDYGEVIGSGGDVDVESVDKWFQRITECEFALKRVGLAGFRSSNALILDDCPVEPELVGPVKRAIHSLAIELGRFPF